MWYFFYMRHTPPLLSVELFLHAFFCKQNSWEILSRMAWTDYKFYKLFRRKYSISGERTKRCLWLILINCSMNFHTKHFEAEKCIQKKKNPQKKTTRNEHSHSKLKNFFYFIFFSNIKYFTFKYFRISYGFWDVFFLH